MPGMDCVVLYNLPTIVMHKLVAQGGDINRKRQEENNSDPLPGRKGRSI
jgi:hypothetical protein